VRVEIGPRDVAGGKISYGRRDIAGKLEPPPRAEFVSRITKTLDEIQHALYERALQFRAAATVRIDNLNEFETFFASDEDNIDSGGFAYCHFVDSPEMDEKLKVLKVTVRCIPLGAEDEPGKCIFTGRPSQSRGVFAKAY
jgi:prolyl-tRNA synthetase